MKTFELTIVYKSQNQVEWIQELIQSSEASILGIEEFNLDEFQVDEILGERSYSGGDLPTEVLLEVESKQSTEKIKIYFQHEAEVQLFQARIQAQGLQTHYVECGEQDWNEEWKKSYSPIELGPQMLILPDWIDAQHFSHRYIVKIHPGMGFGTGTHQTTQLCLEMFLLCASEFFQDKIKILDFGSGSGILGLMAAKIFSQAHVTFVDISVEAHENAQRNAMLNHFPFTQGEWLFPENFLGNKNFQTSYQVVFANILQNTLHELRDELVKTLSQGGFIFLSGLLTHQLTETKEFYLHCSQLQFVDSSQKDEWGALVFKKV
jgi:ribosomal protein L11 methyltransferase